MPEQQAVDPVASIADEGRGTPGPTALPLTALTSLPTALFVIDAGWRIQFANDAFLALVETANVIGRRPHFLRRWTTRALRRRALQNIAAGREWSGTVSVGERKLVLSASPFRTPEREGHARRILCACADTTREADLQARLERAQRLEAVGRLASGMVHDINNILAIIETTATMAQRAATDHPELRDDLAEIRDAVRSAAQLSRQILSFSRGTDGGEAQVDINAFVRRTTHLLRRLVGEDISLESDLGSGIARVSADESQLEQIIANLVINARDAMPQEGGRIRITTSMRDVAPGEIPGSFPKARPGRHVLIGVRDNGSGMDDETLARVFEPFFTTKGPSKGTGLGLATVHSLIEQHGGFLRVSSAVGIGSEFLVHLPSMMAADVAHWSVEESEERRRAPRSTR